MADKRTLTAKEEKELLGYLTEARERHISYSAGLMQGFMAVIVNTDVRIRWGKLVRAGAYFMKRCDTTADLPEDFDWIWRMEINLGDIHKIMEREMERGEDRGQALDWDGEGAVEEEPTVKFRANLVRMEIGEDTPLTFHELMTWLAIQDADESGDADKGDRIFRLTYGKERADFLKALRAEGAQEAGALTLRWPRELMHYTRAATRRKKPPHVTITNAKGEKILKIEAVEDFVTLKAGGRKTFALINAEATRMSRAGEYRHDGETVCRVELDVAEVARLYGITEEWAAKRLRADFKAIANQRLTIEKKGKRGGWMTIPVSGGAFGIRKGRAVFTLSPDVMNILLNPTAPQVDLPPELYATDDTNHPAAFQIGTKLYAQGNVDGPNRDRMKLETLLNAAREIPTAEELRRGRRSPTERIMGPFEEAMNHLVDVGALKAWDYCHEGGEPLADEEHQIIETEHGLGRPTPWDLARKLLVTWELGRRYPMREAARQASRDRRRAEAEEALALRDKEAKAKERRIRGRVEKIEAERRVRENS